MAKTSHPNVIHKSGGTQAYGLFIDYQIFDLAEGTLISQERLFLADNVLCSYSRNRGDKRAAWSAERFISHDKAREEMLAAVALSESKGRVLLTADPLAIELAASDVVSIRNGEAPHCRHLGSVHTEKRVGKVDDDFVILPSTGEI